MLLLTLLPPQFPPLLALTYQVRWFTQSSQSIYFSKICLIIPCCAVLSHSVGSDSVTPWTAARQAPHHGDSPGKNVGVGCQPSSRGIFLTQGLNPGLPHCRWILSLYQRLWKSHNSGNVLTITGFVLFFHFYTKLFENKSCDLPF